MKAIRDHVDYRPCGSVYFTVETNETLTREQIATLQKEAGYHPDGYGGPFDIEKTATGYKWQCWNTCE